MSQIFTYEIITLLTIKIFSIIIETYLAFKLLKKYFTKGHPSTILAFVLTVLTLLMSDIFTFINIFIIESELFIYLEKVSLIFFVISIYFLLLLSEIFENETIFSRQQMIITILATITVMAFFMGTFEVNLLDDLEIIVLNKIDPLTELLILVLSVFTGVLILLNLWKGFQDVWIFQKKQLIYMILGTINSLIIPVLFNILFSFYNINLTPIFFTIFNMMVIIGLIFYYISFKNFNFISLFNRRRADKIIVTNLDGLPLFAYDFKKAVHQIDETLFAGAIVAITMLMTESIKSPAPIEEVVMKNKYRVILESKANILALILTPKGSSYQRESLIRFIGFFELKFGSLVASGAVVDLELLSEGGKGILLKSFGISAG